MKLLHTSDLHIGRQFNGISLEEDHQVVLDQVVDMAKKNNVQALIIAGDIFDRAAPPASAVRQFNAFLTRIASETSAAVAMIAGNHDSGDRIASMSIMTDVQRALIRGTISADEPPFLLSDEHGPIAFSALPFAYEYTARECFADETIETPEDVLTAQIATARSNLPDGARWIVVAHAFVTGGAVSDSERSLTKVGGIETVRTNIFDDAHYVALGHLHRPQFVGAPHIRYSGAPLVFGFDEADSEKSASLVNIDGDGQVKVEEIPFYPRRRARILRGKHAELLLSKPSDDFIKVVLTDKTPVIDGMKRLRDIFPNACEMSYERDERVAEIKSMENRHTTSTNPMEVVSDFLRTVREDDVTDAEQNILASTLSRLQGREDAE